MNLLDIKGVGEKTVEKLAKLDILTPENLLMFTPTKYTNMIPTSISQVRGGCFYVIKAKYVKKLKQFKNKKLNIFSILIMDDDGNTMNVDWFNQDYVSKAIAIDNEYLFYGRVTDKKGKLILINPEFEKAENAKKLKGIRVEYKTKGVLTNSKISSMVSGCIGNVFLDSFITSEIAEKYNLLPLDKAVYNLHFPEKFDDLENNLNRIKLEKIINLMLSFHTISERSKTRRTTYYNNDISILEKAISSLPYTLTSSQQNAISTIVNSLKGDYNASFMLLGDVGSGKTIVAFLMCYYIIKSGGKAVMLVPSETLLKQHYDNASFLSTLGIRVAKLSSSCKTAERKDILNRLNNGEIDLIMGTHSLINDEVNLSDFTFAVIDEQQKFGVNQKGKVLAKLANIDSLIMSATPIPRAINLMFNNTLNVIEITKPESRKTKVKTMLVKQNKLENMLDYFYLNKDNEKTFVVCPSINTSQNKIGVYHIYDYYKNKFGYSPLVINSKVSEEDKTAIMQDFASGKNNILVATTIVEVGIDVADAKNMAVICSECFGLSSLHQLRGRVGRDGREACCYLHYSSENEISNERLNILKNNDNGFEISKLDYSLRGGGEILGTKQSGKLGLIDLDVIDSELIIKAQSIFNDIIKQKIDLSKLDSLTNLFDNINEIVLA